MRLESSKIVFRRGSAADPAGGAYDAPPDPLVGWQAIPPPHSPPLDAFSTTAQFHNFQILQFVHKCIYHHHKLPQILSTYFTKNSMFHTYNTRTKSLHIDFIRSSLGQRCIKYKESVLWNLLPDELRNVESTKSFRNKLKQFCIDCSVNV